MNETIKEKIKNIPILSAVLLRLYWFFYVNPKYKRCVRKTIELKNSERGKRCFIIATGPSIKTQNLGQIQGEMCISVSNFFIHPDFNKIKPRYHLFAASHPPITNEQYTALLRDAEKHFPDGQSVLISVTDRHLVEDNGLFKSQKVYYYYLGGKDLAKESDIDFSREIPLIQTSAQTALYLGFYLGCKEFYMLGCDHNWVLNIGKVEHFYEEKNNAMTQLGYNGWHSEDLGVEFASCANVWRIYRLIREYAKDRKISIYNSPSSLLDLFPKKNLEDFIRPK